MNKKKIAIIFLSIGSLFPLIVGLYYYYHFISKEGLHLIEHVAFTNLIASGATMLILSLQLFFSTNYFLILGLLAISLWVNTNDLYILLRYHFSNGGLFPYSIFPFSLHLIGFILYAIGNLKNDKQ